MNIAQDNTIILIEFELPGADIVGFEHKAETKEDIKNVNNAIAKGDYNALTLAFDKLRIEAKRSNTKRQGVGMPRGHQR